MNECSETNHDREKAAPDDGARCFVRVDPELGILMEPGDFRVGIAAANGTFPPLAKPCDGRVVPGHFGIEPPDLPTPLAQPQAKLRLFAGDKLAR